MYPGARCEDGDRYKKLKTEDSESLGHFEAHFQIISQGLRSWGRTPVTSSFEPGRRAVTTCGSILWCGSMGWVVWQYGSPSVEFGSGC